MGEIELRETSVKELIIYAIDKKMAELIKASGLTVGGMPTHMAVGTIKKKILKKLDVDMMADEIEKMIITVLSKIPLDG